MALSTEFLSGIERALSAPGAGANPLLKIRADFPEFSVTRCDAEDMRGESPYGHSGAYDVYLVDSSSHCWRIIDDPRAATGVVIAKNG